MDPLEIVFRYHQATKHDFQRFARSLGYLDWDTQPDPFRRFAGAPVDPLPLGDDPERPAYDKLFSAGVVSPQPVGVPSISKFLELALGLSAWKQFKGSRWALRMNPSSGNLHPTEGYLLAPAIQDLHDGPAVYHYAPKEHALERRADIPVALWAQLAHGLPQGTLFVGLTSIHWREAWKYGERAYRYCLHDAGHAVAAVAFSALVQGWEVRWMAEVGDAEVAAMLGVDRATDFEGAEREIPECLLAVGPSPALSAADVGGVVERLAVGGWAQAEWHGQANRLSKDHVDWPIIDNVAKACEKAAPSPHTEGGVSPAAVPLPPRPFSAARIIRQRRSAVAMDGKTGIPCETFYRMLDRTIPRWDRVPWNALGPPACVHLGLFVHIVEGIPSGLYCLVRSPNALDGLRAAMRSSFVWRKPPHCPETLPLYLLQEGDCRAVAWRVSCDQEIAGASAFSLGMIAEFESNLQRYGAWFYRRLFWETGIIGQVLYLEAEAGGVRGTGMGCYYDDPVHAVFGLRGREFQSLYHFTIGGAVEDARLTTLPPYGTMLNAEL